MSVPISKFDGDVPHPKVYELSILYFMSYCMTNVFRFSCIEIN